MSVVVPIDELLVEVGTWGFGYLVTVSEDDRPHLVALVPMVDARALRFDDGGGRACRNAAARPAVTIVFPPRSDRDDGFSLVVDGDATVDGDDVVVAPTSAVLHRPAPAVG